MERFLGLDFSPLTLQHRDRLSALLAKDPQPLSGYTFAALIAWDPMFEYRWAVLDDELLLISFRAANGERHLLQPIGPMPPAFVSTLLDRAACLPYPLQITCASKRFVEAYPQLATLFDVAEDRNASNYIYAAEDLAELAGKKYARKRNHISQAAGAYAWSVEPIGPQHVPECLALVEELRVELGVELVGLPKYEHLALHYTLEHLAELRQEGVRIVVDGSTAAFALWEPIGPSMAAVHFERARRSLKGLYQVVNRETATIIRDRGFKLINREEDVGDEGLRKAKLSYYPVEIAPAMTLAARLRRTAS